MIKSDRGKWEGNNRASIMDGPYIAEFLKRKINLSCELIIEDQNCEKYWLCKSENLLRILKKTFKTYSFAAEFWLYFAASDRIKSL